MVNHPLHLVIRCVSSVGDRGSNPPEDINDRGMTFLIFMSASDEYRGSFKGYEALID
jgi:hypothetical protein